jgi:hypothetical protein
MCRNAVDSLHSDTDWRQTDCTLSLIVQSPFECVLQTFAPTQTTQIGKCRLCSLLPLVGALKRKMSAASGLCDRILFDLKARAVVVVV